MRSVKMKKIVVLCVVGLLAGLSFIPVTSGQQNGPRWDEGDSWSFKWTHDYSALTEDKMAEEMGETENVTIQEFHSSGKEGQMFTITYEGKEDGEHRFDYRGGYYGEASLTLNASVESRLGKMTMDAEVDVTKIDIDYNGTLWVTNHEYGYTGGDYAFGVTRQVVNTEGVVDMNSEMKVSGAMGVTQDNDMDVNWESEMDITYEEPMPWIPQMSNGEIVDISFTDVIANMDGEVVGDADYIKETSGFGSSENVNITGPVDTTFSEEKQIDARINRYRGNITTAGPVLRSRSMGFYSVMKEADDSGETYSSVLENSLDSSKAAEIQMHGDGFFEKYCTVKPLSGSLSSDIGFPSIDTDDATRTTEDEVDSFMADKESHMGLEGREDDGSWWIWLLVIGLIVVGVVVYFVKFRQGRGPRHYEDMKGHQPREEEQQGPSQEWQGSEEQQNQQQQSQQNKGWQ